MFYTNYWDQADLPIYKELFASKIATSIYTLNQILSDSSFKPKRIHVVKFSSIDQSRTGK
jgi:hypothetical protein